MKRILVVTLFLLVNTVVSSVAQEKKNLSLLLSGYTFSAKKGVVGQVALNDDAAKISKVRLLGADAKALKYPQKMKFQSWRNITSPTSSGTIWKWKLKLPQAL